MLNQIRITSSLLLFGAFTGDIAFAKNALTHSYGQKAIAAILVAEAGIDRETGMTCVAEVIRNRAREKKKKPLQIIRQRAVFTSLLGRNLDQMIQESSSNPAYPVALKIAALLLHDPDQLPNSTNNATHFDQIDNKPYWTKGAQITATIGHHRFYRTRY